MEALGKPPVAKKRPRAAQKPARPRFWISAKFLVDFGSISVRFFCAMSVRFLCESFAITFRLCTIPARSLCDSFAISVRFLCDFCTISLRILCDSVAILLRFLRCRCDILLCYALLCFSLLSFAMLCFALLCYAMPCSSKPRCASAGIVKRNQFVEDKCMKVFCSAAAAASCVRLVVICTRALG